jgi:hypothetical protein
VKVLGRAAIRRCGRHTTTGASGSELPRKVFVLPFGICRVAYQAKQTEKPERGVHAHRDMGVDDNKAF